MEFWLGMLYTFGWLAFFGAISGAGALLFWLVKGRHRVADATSMDAPGRRREAEEGPGRAGMARAREHAAPAPPVVEAPVRELLVPVPSPLRLTSDQRRHLIIIGAPGDGKTQTQLAFMLGDIANGDQVVWASTNLALYHSRDQRTDLRPIAHLFEHTRDELEIMAVLHWASAEVDRRMPFYHADQWHGEPIVIYVDELGGLYRRFGELLVHAMRNIGEQGRKVDVYLGLVAHNALKESTGLDMALKPLFQTRLLGNVDQATWTAMVGPGVKLRGVPDGQGIWTMPDRRGQAHETQIRRPTARDIEALAANAPAGVHASILQAAAPYRARLAASAPRTASAGEAAPATAAPARWEPTTLHQRVRELVEEATPEILRLMQQEQVTLAKAQELTQTSNRALARRLGLGEAGGSAAVKVRDAITDWQERAGVRLFDVPPSPSPAGRSERPERADHITPAA